MSFAENVIREETHFPGDPKRRMLLVAAYAENGRLYIATYFDGLTYVQISEAAMDSHGEYVITAPRRGASGDWSINRERKGGSGSPMKMSTLRTVMRGWITERNKEIKRGEFES